MAKFKFGLTSSEFFSAVRRNFHFLLDRYGFSVLEKKIFPTHSSRDLVFKRGDLCIEVSHEEATVGVFLFPFSEGPSKGIRIGDLTAFIDREEGKPLKDLVDEHLGHKIDQSQDDRTKIIAGLNWYANLLQRYLDRILPIFEDETVEQRESELEEWKAFWEKQLRKAFLQRLQENRQQ